MNFGYEESMLLCDQQARTISCPTPCKITITSVFHGRLNNWACFTGFESDYNFNPSSPCIVCGAKDVVSAQCNNQQNRAVTALPYNFASSFSVQCNVNKYLCMVTNAFKPHIWVSQCFTGGMASVCL